MQATTSSAGVDPLLEGQRLLAKRHGPVRRWVQEHPLTVNIVLAVCQLIFVAIFMFSLAYSYAMAGIDGFSDQVENELPKTPVFLTFWTIGILSTLAIFWREKYSLVLLLALGAINLTVALLPFLPESPVTFWAECVFIYTLASRTKFVRSIWGFSSYLVLTCLASLIGLLFPDALQRLSNTGTPAATPQHFQRSEILPILGYIVFIVLFCTVIFLAGRAVHRSRMFEQAILASFEQNRRLAVTEERNRIAREMHDVVSHSLTVMIALSDGARIVLRKKPERAEEVLKELSNTGRTALADMRRALGVLRDPRGGSAPLKPTGSGDAVENLSELVESFSATGLPVQFSHSGEAVPDDPTLRLSLYRMTQESLTNVLRYGQNVTLVKVSLILDSKNIYLSIVNDGDTPNNQQPSLGAGKGLVGITERAAFYNGTVDAGLQQQGGWHVHIHLLYPQTEVSTPKKGKA